MNKRFIAISMLMCFSVALSGCKSNEAADVSIQETTAAKTSVEIMKVTTGSIQNEYKYSGKVKPANEVNVLSTVAGKVTTVNYDVGDTVQKDDVLFTMDTTDIINNINTAKASLQQVEANINSAKTSVELVNGSGMQLQIEQAQSGLNNAKSAYDNAQLSLGNAELGVNNAKIAIENAKLNLDKAQLAFNNAKTDFDNYKALYDAGALSQTAYDQYKSAYDQSEIAYNQAKLASEQAQVSLNQAQLSYEQAQNAISQTEEAYSQAQNTYEITVNQMPSENKRKAEDALKVAEASRASILAQIASAEKTLNDATVKSPISGVVTACNVKEGTVLSQGASAPFTIIDMSSVHIEVSVSEQIINTLHIGDSVDIKISAISDTSVKGKISTINPAANATGTYAVKIEIDNSNSQLKSGMFGEVYFAKEKSDNAIILPRSAIISNDEETYVMVEDNGIAKKVNVTLGVDNGTEVEVLSGLVENMNVITKGQSYLSDGDAVEVVSSDFETDSSSEVESSTETAEEE